MGIHPALQVPGAFIYRTNQILLFPFHFDRKPAFCFGSLTFTPKRQPPFQASKRRPVPLQLSIFSLRAPSYPAHPHDFAAHRQIRFPRPGIFPDQSREHGQRLFFHILKPNTI
jgi:hypothetical protein